MEQMKSNIGDNDNEVEIREDDHPNAGRSDDSLKLKELAMKDFAAPKKQPFENSAHQDDSQRKKMENMKMKEKVSGDDHNGGNSSNDSAKPLFHKFSSVKNNEIAILKDIVDFYSENGICSFSEITFDDFAKNSLQTDMNLIDLSDKIDELEKRYKKTMREKDENPKFTESHEQEAFEYLKKIWGSGSGNDENKLIEREKRNFLS